MAQGRKRDFARRCAGRTHYQRGADRLMAMAAALDAGAISLLGTGQPNQRGQSRYPRQAIPLTNTRQPYRHTRRSRFPEKRIVRAALGVRLPSKKLYHSVSPLSGVPFCISNQETERIVFRSRQGKTVSLCTSLTRRGLWEKPHPFPRKTVSLSCAANSDDRPAMDPR